MKFSFQIIDENDNAPVIKIERRSLFQPDGKLPEDAPIGSAIASVTVTDRDSGSNGKVDVELSSNSQDFSLKKVFNQYVIQVQRPLNLDMRSQYKLQIVARDQGSPMLQSNKSLRIELADSNRNAPKFEKLFYTIKVSDDVKAGTIVTTLTATDADKGTNAQLSYKLVRLADLHNVSITQSDNWFIIDALRGSIRLDTKLWCDFTPSFLITAEVQDHGRKPKRSRCTVNLTVTCSKHRYEFHVFEGAPPGTKVGNFGTDLNIPEKKLWVNLIQDQGSFLIVDNSTRELKLAKELDREENSFHLIKGFVTDGTVMSPVEVFIRVLDTNDNVPRFVGINGEISVNIPTNARPGYRVWKVVAKDPDEGRNGEISYSIINSNGENAFTIDREQGHILILKNLTKRSYVVTIRAADNGVKPRQRLVRMKVYLDDTLILPTVSIFTTDSKVAAGVDARGSNKGTFSNKELIIVIVLCTFCGLLIVLLIAVVVFKYKRRTAANKRASYHEAEISREDALKASKKMYKEATTNMSKKDEELNHTKCKNGRAPPLPKKGSLGSATPVAEASLAKAEHKNPNTSYMGSEYVGTDCDTDSGREDVVQFSPYTTHGPAQKKAHDLRAGTFSSPHHAQPPYTPPRKHGDSPSSSLPQKHNVRKPSLVKIPGVTHSATDL